LIEVVRNLVHRFTWVAEILRIPGECLCDRKTAALGFAECERDSVMKPAVPEMSGSRNVRPRPNSVCVKGKQPLSPVPITTNGALILVLVSAEEHSVVGDWGRWGITAIKRGEDNVAHADEFSGLDETEPQTLLQAVPVTVVDCYRRTVPVENRIHTRWKAHDQLE
jgi:hypothetical protein